MKILIIQQKRIGDVLTSTILCDSLKKKYPIATIHFMCYPNCQDVLLGNPNIDSVILLPDETRKSYSTLLKFILKIRSNQYDVLIDVYGKLETNLITLFSGSKYKISYYKWYSSLFYNYSFKRIKKDINTAHGHAIANRLLLLKPLQANQINSFPQLFLTEEENQNGLHLFEQHIIDKKQKVVMISILGSEKSKTYPLKFMAKVVEFVASHKNTVILFNYFPNQIEEAKKIFDLCSKETQQKIHFDLLGKNLRSFITIMNQCDLIIGNDGGAINMAKALNKPSFIIFSPHVRKNDWSTFEDGLKNIAVHLRDYKPELFENLSEKQIKKKSDLLYSYFEPKLIIQKLEFFIAKNL